LQASLLLRSGSLVVDNLTSGGKIDAPVGQNIFWAMPKVLWQFFFRRWSTGASDRHNSYRLPFAMILIVMCFSLYKGLDEDYKKLKKRNRKRT
jgi:choline/glycine/proline betaine transport protein